jgi:DNA (cytosine-5)-methyltransferase 1
MVVADLFAGPGGWSRAALELGLESVGLELDDDAVATRHANGLPTRLADVATTAPPRELEGLIASAPCQTYSPGAGSHGLVDEALVHEVIRELGYGVDGRDTAPTSDPRTLLVVEPVRWTLAARPQWVALEQVPAVLPTWRVVGEVLEEHGYSVALGILDAADYGVPQHRRRAVLIARQDSPASLPTPTHGDQQDLLAGPLEPYVRPCDVLGWAPDDRVGFPRRGDRVGGETIIDGARYRSRDLRAADRPTYTLTGKARSWVRFANGGERHRLTLEEAATLQTFPADHVFTGSRTSRFMQVANAVPPLFARRILEAATRLDLNTENSPKGPR